MKLNAISGLDVTHTETEVYVEVDGKELAVLKAKQVTENGKTRVVLVPSKPRASRSKVATGNVKPFLSSSDLIKASEEVSSGTTDASEGSSSDASAIS